MVVYLDVLIFYNFVVNTFLLYITAQSLRIKTNFKYIIFSGLLGGFYVITLIYPSLKMFSLLPMKIIIAFLMVFICFRKKELLFNVKATTIYILYSMLLAGICVYMEFNKSSDLTVGIIENVSTKSELIALMIVYILVHRLIIYIKDRKDLTSLVYTVDIFLGDTKTTVKAFLDTGNELREPATNLPVIIVERTKFSIENINKYDKFYIPYQVVNGFSGNLEGIKPEYINIYFKEKSEKKEVVIAFTENKLSSLNDYEALLSRGII